MDETELNSYLASHVDFAGSTATQPGVESVRKQVKDVKVQLLDDRVHAYVVFDFHGKDMSLDLEGRLHAANGYLQFEPIRGQIGALPIPQSTLQEAVRRMFDSPENRDKLKLPPEIIDLSIENGEVVISFK